MRVWVFADLESATLASEFYRLIEVEWREAIVVAADQCPTHWTPFRVDHTESLMDKKLGGYSF